MLPENSAQSTDQQITTADQPPEYVGPLTSFKRFFLRGLAALMPTLLTIGILLWGYNLLDQYVVQHVSQGLIAIMAMNPPDDLNESHYTELLLAYGEPIDRFEEINGTMRRLTHEYVVFSNPRVTDQRKQEVVLQVIFERYHLGIVSFAVAIVAIYFVGFFLASFMGRAIWRVVESGLNRVPLVKAIYPHVKQVTDFFLHERKVSFSGVVAVQYPRQGIWTVGLLTGPGLRALHDAVGSEVVSVFIPSSPTPVTGYVINVAASEVVELAISIDDALRFVISGGVIRPETHDLGELASGEGESKHPESVAAGPHPTVES